MDFKRVLIRLRWALSAGHREVVQNMDGWTRKVWTARQYGYSWREIAEHVGLGEQAAKVRFHQALRRLAARLGYGK